MKSIKRALLIIPVLISIASCNNKMSLTASFENYAMELKELNSLLSTNRIGYSLELQVNNNRQKPLTFYSDEEKIINTTYAIAGLSKEMTIEEILTPNDYFLSGDGFNVHVFSDNRELFNHNLYTSFDIRDYIVKIDNKLSTDSCFVFYINKNKIDEIIPDYGVIDDIDAALKEYGVKIKNVCFYAYFENGNISTLSMVFDEEFDKASSRTGNQVRLNYVFNGYGDNLTTLPPIETNLYLSVTPQIFNMIIEDINTVIERGQGFMFDSQVWRKTYVNELPLDECVGVLSLYNHPEYDKTIYFRDLTFDDSVNKWQFTFVGKVFEVQLNYFECTFIQPSNSIEANLNITKDSVVQEDYENRRLLFNTPANNLRIMDTDFFSLIKEIEVEGDIVNIVNHKDVYHVMTVTKYAGYKQYKDSDCAGNIYVIDKKQLEILDRYFVNTYPYNSIIDKRGNIVVSPGFGQHVSLYQYKVSERKLVKFKAERDMNYECDYLEYNADLDIVISNHQKLFGGVRPLCFVYRDGNYVFDHIITCESEGDNNGFTSFGWIYVSCNNLFVTQDGGRIVHVNDNWESCIYKTGCSNMYYSFLYQNKPFEFGFHDEEYVYAYGKIREYNDYGFAGALIGKYRYINNNIEGTTYYYNVNVVPKYVFGLVKENSIYLYNPDLDSFDIFVMP